MNFEAFLYETVNFLTPLNGCYKLNPHNMYRRHPDTICGKERTLSKDIYHKMYENMLMY